MISESNFHFLNKNAQEKNLPAHFPDSCNRYASITGSPKTKAGYPVFAQILGFFPVQHLSKDMSILNLNLKSFLFGKIPIF